jgi:MFS transporter, ACS family, hexuronate transporter
MRPVRAGAKLGPFAAIRSRGSVETEPLVRARNEEGTSTSRIFNYETLVMILMGLAFGIVFFDRVALNVLAPFVVPDLKLNNSELGALAAGLGLTWAISGYGVGALSDYLGNRKLLLVAAIIVFSICSIISGLASSFLMLLGARMVMGVAEGPVLPIAQSIMMAESSEKRRGFNQGVLQNFLSTLMGSFAAPLILVAIGSAYGWRHAFYVAGIPGFVIALLILCFVREPKPVETRLHGNVVARFGLARLLRYRNVWVCTIVACLMIAWVLIQLVFLPIYLVQTRGLTPGEMSIVMAATAVSSAVSSMVVPALSDRFGRRPITVLFTLLSLFGPLTAVLFSGPLPVMCLLMAAGFFAVGSFSLFMATIPSETIPSAQVATTMGFIIGVGEIVGGFSGPGLAGVAADALGASTPFWMAAVLGVIASAASLLIQETAPRIVGQAETLDASSSAEA